jgi:hypothetical protein
MQDLVYVLGHKALVVAVAVLEGLATPARAVLLQLSLARFTQRFHWTAAGLTTTHSTLQPER